MFCSIMMAIMTGMTVYRAMMDPESSLIESAFQLTKEQFPEAEALKIFDEITWQNDRKQFFSALYNPCGPSPLNRVYHADEMLGKPSDEILQRIDAFMKSSSTLEAQLCTPNCTPKCTPKDYSKAFVNNFNAKVREEEISNPNKHYKARAAAIGAGAAAFAGFELLTNFTLQDKLAKKKLLAKKLKAYRDARKPKN